MSTSIKNSINSPAVDQRPARMAVNSGYLLIASGVEALLGIVVLSLAARYLGLAGFGQYGYVISFIELFIMLTELANSRLLVREIAADPENARKHLAGVWTLRWILSIVMIVAVVAAAQGDFSNPQLWLAILFFAVGQVFYNLTEVFHAVFRGYQRMQYQALTTVFGQALILILMFVAIQLNWGLAGLFAVRMVANLLRLALAWFLSRKRFIASSLSVDMRGMWYLFKESFPLGFNMFVRRYIWRGGIVVLTLMLNAQAAGSGDIAAGLIYGPIRIVEQMRIVPAALIGAILPVFSLQARVNEIKFRDTLAQSLKLFITVSLLIAVMMTTLAKPITDIVLGNELSSAAGVLGIFGWIILFTFTNQFYEAALLAVGKQWVVAAGLGGGFLISGALTRFVLIERFQAVGVAYGIMLAEGIVFVISTVALLPYLKKRELGFFAAKIIVASAVTGIVFYALRHWSVFVVGPIGLLVFGATTLLVRAFSPKELEAIVAMFTFHKRLRWIRRRLFNLDERGLMKNDAQNEMTNTRGDA